jgi:hypothetical protein
MKTTTAHLCFITLSLVSIAIPAQPQPTAASGSGIAGSPPGETHETTKPAEPAKPGTANPNEAARGMPPAGKAGQGPVPRDRTQEIEERVQSGQVDQKEVSGRLEELQSGSNPLPDETGTGHSSR